ncbi:GTPase [Yoonia sp.]|uniref:GTPase n=1 Tax=Yoonia sp. TaxID=2212373 RepID=UPI0039771123
MSNQSPGNRVQSELEQAVASGLLPDSVQQKAEHLLMRLQQPVRLALLGMPGSGKSTLINLLVGSDVIPDGVRLPTLQLIYGETEKTTCTLPDGSKTVLDSVDLNEIAALSPVFVEMQMPLPALRKISLLEVVAPNDPNAIHRAAQWAAKRSDVALWCTRGFNETEQRIWGTMPDLTKDHAFCMITRADYLKTEGLFEATVGAVKLAAKDEFSEVLPIATTQGIAARRADGTVDKAAMRDSGSSGLISAVLKQVERGRQSAVDMADVLLHQHADLLASIDKRSAPPEDEVAVPEPVAPKSKAVQELPVAETPKDDAVPEPVPEEPAKPAAAKPAAQDAISRLRAIAARKNVSRDAALDPAPTPAPAAELTAEQTPAVAEDKENDALAPATREAYEHVITYIAERGAELAATLDEQGDGGPAEVMSMTSDHIQWLCDYLNENGDVADQSLQRVRETAFDAADMVQLMQMEKGDSAALEAVSLMLQLKREIQADLAA